MRLKYFLMLESCTNNMLSIKIEKVKDFSMGSETVVTCILPFNLTETEKIIAKAF